MAARNTKKVLGTVLALGAATGAIVFGSFAAWTAQSSNNGNSVTTGTLDFTNSKPSSAAVFAITGAKPGDTGGDDVTLTNSGTTPISTITLTQGNVANTIGSDIKLKIHDDTANYCIWPDKAAGSCTGYGAWTHADLTGGLTTSGTLAGGASRTFSIDWEFDANSGNGTKSKAASFDLTWDGAQ